MGFKYAFRDHSQLHFVTFTVVGWIDVFTREEYRQVFYESIRYCQQHKGLEVYGYVIMTNHIHLIIGAAANNLSDIVRDLKSFTSRHIRKAIEANVKESRKEWMLNIFTYSGKTNPRNKDFQLWRHENHPVELSTAEMLRQRLDYMHRNPVALGLVNKEEDWVHSSAADYSGSRKKGMIDITFIE